MWKPKLTKLVCVTFVLLSQASLAKDLQCKNDYESIISKNIVAMSTAFNNGDWQYIENKTDTTLINYAGGKEAYKGLLASAVDTFKKTIYWLQKLKLNHPKTAILPVLMNFALFQNN